MVFSFTCLFAQIDMEPKITTIDGEVAYCFNGEQFDSLLVKFSTARIVKQELKSMEALVKELGISVAERDTMLVIKKGYLELLQEDNDDCMKLLKNRNPWWKSRSVGFVLGVLTTYFAIDLATNIN
jgi:hypothetical protein